MVETTRKSDEVCGPPIKRPQLCDVEMALRGAVLGGFPKNAEAVHQLITGFRERTIESHDDLLLAMKILRIPALAPQVHEAILRASITPDFENFDANLESKARNNYLPGKPCRNAADFLLALTEEANTESRPITLPKHLWEKIDKSVAQRDSQIAAHPESTSLFIDRAIRSFLENSAEENHSK